MLWRMIRRDIKGTFGRFASVLAIIAIGTGFFCGVRITTPAMLNTINDYYRESRFFDYRLISTVGWTDTEVEQLEQISGVRSAEGSWQYDVLCLGKNGAEAVYKVHSITEDIDLLRIKKGRMPQNSRECVIDNSGRMGLSLGDTIRFSEENDADTLDAFSDVSFTVVGFADSPLYINFERGTTSIGNGTVQGFLYLPAEAFAADAYTEVYVKLDSDNQIYSSGYKNQMDELRPEWETIVRDTADGRYETLYADAEAELSDARTEFEDEKQKGEKELADAAEEISDGKQKLADAADELEDGRQKLADAAAELENGRNELDQAAAQLEDAKSELDRGALILADTKEQLDAAATALEEGRKQLESGRAELNNIKDQLDAAKEELAKGKAELDARGTELDGYAELLAEGKNKLDENHELLMEKEAELAGAQADIDRRKAEIKVAAAAGLIDEETAQTAMGEIEIFQQMVNAGREQYEAGLAEYQAAVAEYDQNEAAYNSGRAAYEAGLAEYNSRMAEYEAGVAAYEQGSADLKKAEAVLDENTKAYNIGLAEYNNALDQFERGSAEYNNGYDSYLEGLAEYEQGLAEYEDGVRELADAQAEYEDGVKELADAETEYEDAKKTFDEEIADAEKELQDAEEDLAGFKPPDTYLLERGTNIGYACFESDSEIIKQIARVLPVFFILVSILVCITTMTRMVEERRGQIGIMKGMGYSGGDIMFTFLAYSGIAAALGCIIGYTAGIFLFPSVIWFAYNMMYIDVPLKFMFDWKLACIVFIVSVAAAMGTTYLTCRNTLTESAASLMRPKAPKAGKRVILEYIPAIWKRMRFMHKVSARNILRYKKRFFMMVVGISGCTALLLTGFGIKDSIATFVKTQYDEIQTAQVSLVTKDEAETSRDLMGKMDELGASCFIYNQSSWDLVMKNRTKSITLIAPSDWTDIDSFFRLQTAKGKEIPHPDTGEALISVSIAKRYDLKAGDEIILRDEDMNTIHARVSGVFVNYVYNYVVVSRETLNSAGGGYSSNGIYVNFPEGTDIYEAQAELAKCDNVVSVTVFADTEKMIANMMSSLNYVVLLIIVSAAALAFVVLYNLTNINILERIREIATIKVLGFQRRETAEYVFRENLVLTTIGMVIGLGLGVLLHSFVIDQIAVDLVYFKKQITFLSFVLSIILTYSFTYLVNLIMSVKLDRINMAESLKSVE